MISKKIVKNTAISLLFRIGKRKISFRYAVGNGKIGNNLLVERVHKVSPRKQ
jgi:hypothetical protein